jgi:thiol-disulfide isomerase/thioredoxin
MKKTFPLLIVTLLLSLTTHLSIAQPTTAMDFNRVDCDGNMHRLFANDLDSGNVVIIEFFMGGGCMPCIEAGQTLETLKTALLAAHPDKIRSYATCFLDTYGCPATRMWVISNHFTSTPIDTGHDMVMYYGGFGMPTVVVLAGTDHSVIYLSQGFPADDTTLIKNRVDRFYAGTLDVKHLPTKENPISVYPNPANDVVNISMAVREPGNLSIQITDVTGKNVRSIIKEKIKAGEFVKTLNVADLPGGVYMVKTTVNETSSYSKFTITR